MSLPGYLVLEGSGGSPSKYPPLVSLSTSSRLALTSIVPKKESTTSDLQFNITHRLYILFCSVNLRKSPRIDEIRQMSFNSAFILLTTILMASLMLGVFSTVRFNLMLEIRFLPHFPKLSSFALYLSCSRVLPFVANSISFRFLSES
jgi:hypothetical protein